MATKYYAVQRQYKLPAGSFGTTYMDGVYIDGGLFENNVPVRDGVIRIDIKPRETHWVDHWANFGFPTYRNGQVIRIGHKFTWAAFTGQAQAYDLDYNGYPYGIGLNTIAIELSLYPLPITRDIIYDVLMGFVMEVG